MELTTDKRVEVEDLATDGRGLAKVDGKVTFIAGALPGERVRYAPRRRGRSADEGQLVAIENPSPQRVPPKCAHFGLCGGCSLQHLSREGQWAFKQKQLLDALERIGKVMPATVAPPVTGNEWGYRRKARLSVKHVPKKGGVLVGFREADSPYVAQIDSCVVLDPRVGQKLKAIAACIEELDAKTLVPQIEVAAAESVALVFRVMQLPTPRDVLTLKAFGKKHGFDVYTQTAGLDTIKPLEPDAPALFITPDGSDLRLEFRPADFVQVNDAVNRKMVKQALEWLAVKPGDTVLELFSGLGNFSLPLAAAGAKVTAAEGDPGLVARARDNARRNALDIRFEAANLSETDPKVDWLAAQYDAALIDPPRAGAREVLPAVADAGPQRILYVSCHPGTLARDAGYLVHERGYGLERAGILDMFPHTNHVESMALFRKGR